MTTTTRPTFTCPDCIPGYAEIELVGWKERTGVDGVGEIFAHSDACTWLGAQPEDDRSRELPDGFVMHLAGATKKDVTL